MTDLAAQRCVFRSCSLRSRAARATASFCHDRVVPPIRSASKYRDPPVRVGLELSPRRGRGVMAKLYSFFLKCQWISSGSIDGDPTTRQTRYRTLGTVGGEVGSRWRSRVGEQYADGEVAPISAYNVERSSQKARSPSCHCQRKYRDTGPVRFRAGRGGLPRSRRVR